MSFCPECGSEVAEQDKFCRSCGAKLSPVIREKLTEGVEKLYELRKMPFEERVKTLDPIMREVLTEFAHKRLHISIGQKREKGFWELDLYPECILEDIRYKRVDHFWRLYYRIPTRNEEYLFGFELIEDELLAFAARKKRD